MKRIIWAPVAMSLALHVGCGGGATNNAPEATPSSGAPAATASPETPAAPAEGTSQLPNRSVPAMAVSATGVGSADGSVQVPEDPKEIVRSLLDGMRSGNNANLELLFSSAARIEFEKQGIELSPIGSPEAVFEVQDAALQNESMIVSTKLLEPTPQEEGSEPKETEILWELRKEMAGWRICAMAVDQGDGTAIQVVNFENMSEEMQPAPDQPANGQPESRVAALPGGAEVNSAPALPNTIALPAAGQPSDQVPGALPALPPANQLR